MARVAIIGNAGGGKSTLARIVAARHGLQPVELDRFLWSDGWVPTPAEVFERAHADVLGRQAWVIEGLGRQDSTPGRLARATEIVLVDMPLWVHFWLAAERQIAWTAGTLDHPPAAQVRPPPIEALFRTMWEVDRDWMPAIRAACLAAEAGGTPVTRIAQFANLEAGCRPAGAVAARAIRSP